MTSLAQNLIFGLFVGSIYGIAAAGLALVFGVMKMLNVAHGELLMIGGYVSFWLFRLAGIDPFISILISAPLVFLLGLALYQLLFRHIAKFGIERKIRNSLLISFGLVLIMQNLAQQLWSADERSIQTAYSGAGVDVMGIALPYTRLANVGLALLVVVALQLFLSRTYLGKAMRATAEEWESAVLVGVNIRHIFRVTIGLGAALAAIAGTLVAVGYDISPSIGLRWTLKALVVVILAGTGSAYGILPAGLLLGVGEALSGVVAGAAYREVFGLVIFVVVLILRPQGLFGQVAVEPASGDYQQPRVVARVGEKDLESVIRWIVVAAIVIAVAMIPRLTMRSDILSLLFLIFVYVCLGQSWNILAGFAGQVSLGHAAFFGFGALVTRALWFEGLPFPVAFLAGGLLPALGALLIGLPTFRLRGAYFSIGTLAIAEISRITIGNTLPLISSLPVEMLVSYDLTARYYLAFGVALVTMLATYLLNRSRFSLGLRAIREDEAAAQASGVRVLPHKLAAFALSSFFAGLAGATYAFYQVGYYPAAPFGPAWTFDALLITFIGGVGTVIGPVLGTVFYVGVRERLAVTLVGLHPIIFGVLFILVVLILPGGIVDIWTRLRRLIRRHGEAVYGFTVF